MARKKEEKPQEESVVVKAAKAIGSAAGKLASMAGAGESAAPKVKKGKLQKKNKTRLPRKEKKKQMKTARKTEGSGAKRS